MGEKSSIVQNMCTHMQSWFVHIGNVYYIFKQKFRNFDKNFKQTSCTIQSIRFRSLVDTSAFQMRF